MDRAGAPGNHVWGSDGPGGGIRMDAERTPALLGFVHGSSRSVLCIFEVDRSIWPVWACGFHDLRNSNGLEQGLLISQIRRQNENDVWIHSTSGPRTS